VWRRSVDECCLIFFCQNLRHDFSENQIVAVFEFFYEQIDGRNIGEGTECTIKAGFVGYAGAADSILS